MSRAKMTGLLVGTILSLEEDSAIQWNFPSPLIPVSHVRQFTLQESRVRIAFFWSVWLACSTHQLSIKLQLLLYADGYKKATCCHF